MLQVKNENENNLFYSVLLLLSYIIGIYFFLGARAVFERWMEWEPPEQAWLTYIKFELRYHEVDRARKIYNNFVMVHPDVTNWIRYARYIIYILKI